MKKLRYKFVDEKLFALALTQSGADAVNNNERLEFIGDRVLGLSVAALLYEMFPSETEGDLARRHAVLVSTETLAEVAKELGFDKKIRHGHMTAGKMNHIAANAMESVLGAIFLDGGFPAASAEVTRIWRDLAARDAIPPKDSKTALQEFVQKNGGGALPEYEFIDEDGKSHSPVFKVRVSALGQSALGSGASKKSATSAAATELLKILQ
ncbi:MAG: ribonuclease III [Alphaproteobacteria bacterium]|nr:ribonuclease III [Alphaproteobacteria bacterium]